MNIKSVITFLIIFCCTLGISQDRYYSVDDLAEIIYPAPIQIKHKIFPSQRIICSFDENNEITTGWEYPEGALFRVTPTEVDKVYNIVVYVQGQKIGLPNCWILDENGQPIEWTPLRNQF